MRIEWEVCAGTHLVEGTGVAVAPELIATVAHSFERTRAFEVLDAGGTARPAQLVWLDRDRDLALVRLDRPLDRALPLGDSPDGAEVTVLTAAGDELASKAAVVLAHVDATLDGVGERAAIELRADIAGGDSGAPVVNGAGEVIGIVFATVRGEDRGWAVASAEIGAALAQHQGDPIPLDC